MLHLCQSIQNYAQGSQRVCASNVSDFFTRCCWRHCPPLSTIWEVALGYVIYFRFSTIFYSVFKLLFSRTQFIDACSLLRIFCEHVASKDLSQKKVPYVQDLTRIIFENVKKVPELCHFQKSFVNQYLPSRSGNPNAGLLIVQYVIVISVSRGVLPSSSLRIQGTLFNYNSHFFCKSAFYTAHDFYCLVL
jgi:hypothetical protein